MRSKALHIIPGGVTMIRSELIQKIADENPHLYQRDVERIVNTIFEEVTGAMSKGDRVELRGFGAFSVKKRDARVGRNPRTGETVHVEEKHVPFFLLWLPQAFSQIPGSHISEPHQNS